jgi:hypothetical protein
MDWLPVAVTFGILAGLYGGGLGLAVWRGVRDGRRQGALAKHDGQPLLLAAHQYRSTVERVFLDGVGKSRVRIDGVAAADTLQFRLRALTKPKGEVLDDRLVLEGKGSAELAERLFATDEVRAALQLLCASNGVFRGVDLYPGGALIADVESGVVDDVRERLLRFAEAVDAALPRLPREAIAPLGAASGASGSPVTFSIEVRR